MSKPRFEPGDLVIYSKAKHSTHPGPRAKRIVPAPMGEHYSYQVDKFWIVVDKADDLNFVVLQTRQGKKHLIKVDDPNLRRCRLWERLLYRDRFPKLTEEVVA